MAELPDFANTSSLIIEQTNQFRAVEGRNRVAPNAVLTAAATAFARYLAKSGRFAHEADGRKPADRAAAAGYDYCAVAENLALNLDSGGFTSRDLARKTTEGWKNSPGHRHNMLLPHVTEIGIGIAQAPGADPKFLTVQLFGRPKSLALNFKVVNHSPAAVTYSLSGKTYEIEPNVTATHLTCEPGTLAFLRGGNWGFGRKLEARYEARNGAVYSLRAGSDGNVRVQLEK